MPVSQTFRRPAPFYYMSRVVKFGLTIALGLVFILSAYGKITGIEFFELDLVRGGLAGWSAAALLARLVIGVELFTAIILLLNIRMKQFTLPWVAGWLVLFTLYLLFMILAGDSNESCNCFGPRFRMTPGESILKNLVLIAVTLYLYRSHPGTEWPKPFVILGGVMIFSLALPFILQPAPASLPSGGHITLPADTGFRVLCSGNNRPFPDTDLCKGKLVVAFLSATCPGCLLTGYKLGVMKEKNPSLPVVIMINGKIHDIIRFRKLTRARRVPHAILLQPRFAAIAGTELPAVYLVENGLLQQRLEYNELDAERIHKWMTPVTEHIR